MKEESCKILAFLKPVRVVVYSSVFWGEPRSSLFEYGIIEGENPVCVVVVNREPIKFGGFHSIINQSAGVLPHRLVHFMVLPRESTSIRMARNDRAKR
jgi:hypothetical protein